MLKYFFKLIPLWLGIFFTFSFAVAAPAALAAPITPAEIQTLQGGTILVKEVPEAAIGYRAFLAHAVITAPIAAIYRVLIDFPAYPEFMPNVEKVIVRAADQQ